MDLFWVSSPAPAHQELIWVGNRGVQGYILIWSRDGVYGVAGVVVVVKTSYQTAKSEVRTERLEAKNHGRSIAEEEEDDVNCKTVTRSGVPQGGQRRY